MSKKKKISKARKQVAKKQPTKRKRKKKQGRTKGVQYLAQKLHKYFKNKYPTYQSALPRARELFATIKADKDRKVNIKNLFDLERKHRGPKGDEQAPFVNPRMFDVVSFFEPGMLESNYPTWISEASNKIEFRSKISPEELSVFPGGSKVNYDTHFKDFVNHCNRMFNLMRAKDEIPETDDGALITTSLPKQDKKTKQWYCEISPCDVFGEDQDYKFDPKNPKAEPTEIVIPSEDTESIMAPGPKKPEPPKEEPKKEVPSGPTTTPPEQPKGPEIEKQRLENEKAIRLAEIQSSERVKFRALDDLKEMLKSKDISFAEYLQGIKELGL